LAPIPSASAAIATTKNPGLLVTCRNVYRRFALETMNYTKCFLLFRSFWLAPASILLAKRPPQKRSKSRLTATVSMSCSGVYAFLLAHLPQLSE